MTATEMRMPPIGADVCLRAYCRACFRELGYWRFEWDGEPHTFTGHICGGNTQDVAYEMTWMEIGEEQR